MAKTVNEAFGKFMTSLTEIEKEENKKAKESRDWLLKVIQGFDDADDFIKLYPDVNFHYGSFARKTKIPPLDDIDLMIGVSAMGSSYNQFNPVSEIDVTCHPDAKKLLRLCYDETMLINSRKVINAFISKLAQVPQYKKAEIKRNGAACTLSLTSYPWNFDIVPCFFTVVEVSNRNYYLIPNGDGKWKKTDPRIDQENITSVNQRHNGHALRIIRIIKYWQRRPTMPTIKSYLLETIVLNYFKAKPDIASQFPDMELPSLFDHIANAIKYPVTDPKGIEGDINDVSWEDRQKIAVRSSTDAGTARTARLHESNQDHQQSINSWRQVFGDGFPKFE